MSDRGRLSDLGLYGLAALAFASLAFSQPRVAHSVAQLKDTSDVYPLPPTEQLPVYTLGYDFAAADLLWAHTLVLQGLRLQQRRHFDDGVRYFESVLALDPTFRTPYLYVDAVLTFGAVRATLDDIHATRAILERGAAARPNDAEIAYQAGSFIAYVAPGYLQNEEEAQRWEREGAAHLARAAQLGTNDSRMQMLALGGATLLSRRGQRAAAISMLQRALVVAVDEEVRKDIMRRLGDFSAEESVDTTRERIARFERAWREDLPFVSVNKEILLGAPLVPAECVGARWAQRRVCSRSWSHRLDDP